MHTTYQINKKSRVLASFPKRKNGNMQPHKIEAEENIKEKPICMAKKPAKYLTACKTLPGRCMEMHEVNLINISSTSPATETINW